MPTRLNAWAALAAVLFALSASPWACAQSAEPVVFAAASLKTALDDISALYAAETGRPRPKLSYAGSNVLAKQIEQGAPADIFISADLDWMDYAAGRGLIRAATRVNLLGNALVLVAARDAPAAARTLTPEPGLDLRPALAGGRLAIANVEATPAGKYGKAALEALGAWTGVRDRLAQSESVRAALVLVARGESPLGLVYQTDAAAEPSVSVVARLPAHTHPPIVYPAALTRVSAHPDAAAFLAFLRGAKARASFEAQGFTFLNQPAPGA